MCSFRQGPTPSAAIATTGPSSWSMRIWSYNCVTRASPSRHRAARGLRRSSQGRGGDRRTTHRTPTSAGRPARTASRPGSHRHHTERTRHYDYYDRCHRHNAAPDGGGRRSPDHRRLPRGKAFLWQEIMPPGWRSPALVFPTAPSAGPTYYDADYREPTSTSSLAPGLRAVRCDPAPGVPHPARAADP